MKKKPVKLIKAKWPVFNFGKLTPINFRKEIYTNFPTGAIRDAQDGKYDISEYTSDIMLHRFYEHMWKNAKKYGSGNWRKGMPRESGVKSLRRHMFHFNLMENEGLLMCKNNHLSKERACSTCNIDIPVEDHLAAIIFNVQIIMHAEKKSVDNQIDKSKVEE